MNLKNLLPRVGSENRQLLSNILWQSVAQVFARLFNFAIFILVANLLGVEGLGRFAFALAFAQTVGVFIDFGMNPILTREAVQGQVWGLFKTFAILKVVLAILLGSTAFAIGRLIFDYQQDGATSVALALGAITSLSFLNLLFALLRARQEMVHEALFTLFHRLVYLLLALVAFYYWTTVNGVLIAYAASGLLTFILLFRFVLHRYSEPGRQAVRVDRTLLGQIMPLLIIDFFTLVYFRIDTLMLQSMKGYAEVGIYNAAYRLFEALIIVPSILAIAFFPRLVREVAQNNRTRHVQLYFSSFVLLGIFIALVLFPLSNLIFPLIYGNGQDFSVSVSVFQLLLVAFLVVCVNYPITQIAIATGEQKPYAVAVIVAGLVNIGLNYLVIPRYGAMGAAGVSIVTELTLLLLLGKQLKKALTEGRPLVQTPHSQF